MADLSFSWYPGDLEAVIAILLGTVGFVAYWFISEFPKIRQRFFNKYDADTASVKHVFFQKMTGLVFLGIIPGVVAFTVMPYDFAAYGISTANLGQSMLWLGGLGGAAIVVNIIRARNPANLVHYPQIRAREWDTGIIIRNAIGWILYLLGYEFLFRGILLFPCVDVLGVWPAIAINIALYSAVHIPKGATETIAAIPFGLLVCWITLKTGTIWTAFGLHVCIALSNSFTAFYFHPEMRKVAKRS